MQSCHTDHKLEMPDAERDCAGGINNQYKSKARALLFNLRDANNPQLRQRVLTGDIQPDALVQMSSEELASKVRCVLSHEQGLHMLPRGHDVADFATIWSCHHLLCWCTLTACVRLGGGMCAFWWPSDPFSLLHYVLQELSQWRKQREQEALKASVLDEEAAAKFSTAAALAQKAKEKQASKQRAEAATPAAEAPLVCASPYRMCLAPSLMLFDRLWPASNCKAD